MDTPCWIAHPAVLGAHDSDRLYASMLPWFVVTSEIPAVQFPVIVQLASPNWMLPLLAVAYDPFTSISPFRYP